MQVIAKVDPFTYAVHAFKCLLLKNTGFGAIAGDLAYLVVFSHGGHDAGDPALPADAVTARRAARDAPDAPAAASTPPPGCLPSVASST